MIEGISIAALNGFGVVGAAMLTAIGFASGRIYTKAQVVEMQARHTAEIDRLTTANEREVGDANHERSEWRTEARLNQQAVVELTEQNRAMLNAFGPTLASFLDSMRQVANLKSEAGEPK